MLFMDIGGRAIEYRVIPGAISERPPLVFLHEGLGCAALWRDFPDKVARELGARALVYSRFGYGQSAGLDGPRTPRFMHEEALDVLPVLLDRAGISNPLLIGHSDGASIALTHAASAGRPVAGLVLMAPHIEVEPICVESIARISATYAQGPLRARLARYHAPRLVARGGSARVKHTDTSHSGERRRIRHPGADRPHRRAGPGPDRAAGPRPVRAFAPPRSGSGGARGNRRFHIAAFPRSRDIEGTGRIVMARHSRASVREASKGGKARTAAGFDLDDPVLPKAIEEASLGSGGYPYDKKMKRGAFEEELKALQIQLARLQSAMRTSGERIVCLFEGRDSAGKGTCINHFVRHLNPRHARVVALDRPTETESRQWYFQRYVPHLPPAGGMSLFDRSWYNRAGVEHVMGFCTEEQHAVFLREAPEFEGMLVRDGIRLFKFYLEIGREMQLVRFHERRHDPLKQWKISDIDLAAMARYDDYSAAKEEMFRFTHTATAPWTVILANDQRRARLEAIRAVLCAVDYAGKDASAIGRPDASIVGAGPGFFRTR